MRGWPPVLLALLLAACAGPAPRPTVVEREPGPGAPTVTIGGTVRSLYGTTR